MFRPVLTGLVMLTLAACASTSGNAYRYDAGGDYYSSAGGAEVMVDSAPDYYGGSGWGHLGGYGYGYGSFGYGLGYGYGYGYGYGAYGPWGFAYPFTGGWPIYVVPDPSSLRQARVERDRAQRSALVWRPTVQAPLSRRFAPQRPGPVSGDAFGRRADEGAFRAPPALRSSRAAELDREARRPVFAPRPSSAPAPTRMIAPPPPPPSRKQ